MEWRRWALRRKGKKRQRRPYTEKSVERTLVTFSMAFCSFCGNFLSLSVLLGVCFAIICVKGSLYSGVRLAAMVMVVYPAILF